MAQDQSIGEAYAKMKAEPCKFVGDTLEGSNKKIENGTTQAKSEGQNIGGTFQYKTGPYFLANGGNVTLRWHTPLSGPFNRGRLCKNEGQTAIQNQHTGGSTEKQWEMKQRKQTAKIKT